MTHTNKRTLANASLIFTTLALGLQLVGCSAHVSGGGSPTDFPGMPDMPTLSGAPAADGWSDTRSSVAGPVINGTYVTDCLPTMTGNAKSFRLELTFAATSAAMGGTLDTKQNNFSDDYCQTAVDSTDEAGAYRFVKAEDDGSTMAEYRKTLAQNGHEWSEGKIWVDGNSIFMASGSSGDSASKPDAARLTLKGQTPAPVATPVPAATPSPYDYPSQPRYDDPYSTDY